MVVMKHHVLVLAMLMACGGGDDGDDGRLLGTWTGTAGGYAVTADVEAEYANGGSLVLGNRKTGRGAEAIVTLPVGQRTSTIGTALM